jgi:hypothetical protein
MLMLRKRDGEDRGFKYILVFEGKASANKIASEAGQVQGSVGCNLEPSSTYMF